MLINCRSEMQRKGAFFTPAAARAVVTRSSARVAAMRDRQTYHSPQCPQPMDTESNLETKYPASRANGPLGQTSPEGNLRWQPEARGKLPWETPAASKAQMHGANPIRSHVPSTRFAGAATGGGAFSPASVPPLQSRFAVASPVSVRALMPRSAAAKRASGLGNASTAPPLASGINPRHGGLASKSSVSPLTPEAAFGTSSYLRQAKSGTCFYPYNHRQRSGAHDIPHGFLEDRRIGKDDAAAAAAAAEVPLGAGMGKTGSDQLIDMLKQNLMQRLKPLGAGTARPSGGSDASWDAVQLAVEARIKNTVLVQTSVVPESPSARQASETDWLLHEGSRVHSIGAKLLTQRRDSSTLGLPQPLQSRAQLPWLHQHQNQQQQQIQQHSIAEHGNDIACAATNQSLAKGQQLPQQPCSDRRLVVGGEVAAAGATSKEDPEPSNDLFRSTSRICSAIQRTAISSFSYNPAN